MIHKFSLLESLLLRFNVIPHPVLDALTSVVAGRALQVSVSLGIFKVLSEEEIKISVLAKKTSSDPEGLNQLIGVLEALGYVKRQHNDKISLTKRGHKFFSETSNSSMSNTILFSDYVYNSLSNLEENIKSRGPKDVNLDVFSPKEWDTFNNAMKEIALSNVTEIANLVPVAKGHKKLLDIGGSHGLYAMEICRKNLGLTAEVMDLSPVKSFAEKIIKENNMSDRVNFRVGDFHKDVLGKNYDIILAFNVIHGLNEEKNRKLTKKIFEALNPGGSYIILDQMKEASGTSDLSKLVASSQGLMLFNVAGGKTYSYIDVKNWLAEAGFQKSTTKKLRAPGNALIIGRK